MVNIFEILPFLTLKGLTHGSKILARKSSNVALDSPQNSFFSFILSLIVKLH